MVVEFNESMIFPALVLKGIVEHEDAAAYFTHPGHIRLWLKKADSFGWISERCDPRRDRKLKASPDGVEAYFVLCLDHFPKDKGTRGYLWDWKSRFGRHVNVLDTDARGRHASADDDAA